jgi:hypothetical protein
MNRGRLVRKDRRWRGTKTWCSYGLHILPLSSPRPSSNSSHGGLLPPFFVDILAGCVSATQRTEKASNLVLGIVCPPPQCHSIPTIVLMIALLYIRNSVRNESILSCTSTEHAITMEAPLSEPFTLCLSSGSRAHHGIWVEPPASGTGCASASGFHGGRQFIAKAHVCATISLRLMYSMMGST